MSAFAFFAPSVSKSNKSAPFQGKLGKGKI